MLTSTFNRQLNGMLKPTIFREYDIRGVADTELSDAGVEQLGRAFGTYLQRHAGKKINLGRDTRWRTDATSPDLRGNRVQLLAIPANRRNG